MLYHTARVKNGSNSFEKEISTLRIERPDQPIKVEDEELENILDENSYQIQSKLANALEVT